MEGGRWWEGGWGWVPLEASCLMKGLDWGAIALLGGGECCRSSKYLDTLDGGREILAIGGVSKTLRPINRWPIKQLSQSNYYAASY